MMDFPELNTFAQTIEDYAKGMVNFRLRGMPVDIKEYTDKIVVDADLPGFNKDEIDVNYSNGRLAIRAEKKQEPKPECECSGECGEECQCEKEHDAQSEFRYLCRERLPEKNSRVFAFGKMTNIDEDKIEASFENGVLTIVMYKKKPDNYQKNIKIM